MSPRSNREAKPPWKQEAEQLAKKGHLVNARGERIYPLELPPAERDRLALDEAIREKMLETLGGSVGFHTVPTTRLPELARVCSLDIGREVTEEQLREYLASR